jgi:hypothetical protein
MIEIVAQALGQIRRQLRDEFVEQLAQLRAEISIAKAHESGKTDHRRCRCCGGDPMPPDLCAAACPPGCASLALGCEPSARRRRATSRSEPNAGSASAILAASNTA